MTEVSQPAVRPARPFFSSGPCAKRPGWTPEALNGALVGRSHRSKPGKTKLKDAIVRTKKLLGIPDDYRVGIVPASDTGAVEMALWSLLG
ncbi:MAG: phosphoserine aminotransferase, partial [Rhizomicrobium sp.]